MSIENSKEVNTITPESVDSAASSSDRPASSLFRKIFSFPVLMGALLVASAVFASRFNLPDPDLWWSVAIGKHILATHAVPTSDAHSFTAPGAPWMAYEWLGEVVIAASALLDGLRGMTALLFLLSATFMALFYGYATLVSGNSKAALIPCAVALPLLKVFFTVRPQLFGYIFLIVTLIVLERFRQGKQKTLWILPPLFLIWVNTHGSFVFGLTVLGIYWASGLIEFEAGGLHAERWTDGQRRHLEIIFLLCVLALLVSPYGTHQAAYPLQMAFFEPVNVSHINEWQALTFQFWQTKLLLVMVLVFWLAQIPAREHYRLESIVLLLLATYACFTHRRFIPFLMLIMVPLLAKLIARWAPAYDPSIDKFVINAVLIIAIATGLIFALPSQKKLEDVVGERYPQKAIEYFDQHPLPGHTLNDYGWGGYLIYSPDYHQKVFVDGRADFYEYAGVLTDYFDMTDVKPDALFLLRKYNIQSCLLHQDAPLGTMLAAIPGWKEVYKDNLAAIFVRRPAEPQPIPPAPAETTRQNHSLPR